MNLKNTKAQGSFASLSSGPGRGNAARPHSQQNAPPSHSQRLGNLAGISQQLRLGDTNVYEQNIMMTRALLQRIQETESEFDENFKIARETMHDFVSKLLAEIEKEHDKQEQEIEELLQKFKTDNFISKLAKIKRIKDIQSQIESNSQEFHRAKIIELYREIQTI